MRASNHHIYPLTPAYLYQQIDAFLLASGMVAVAAIFVVLRVLYTCLHDVLPAMCASKPKEDTKKEKPAYTLPGATLLAYLMLPFRIALWLVLFFLMYPILTLIAFFRAVFMRIKYGAPSKILKYGTKGNSANPDDHYPGHQIYKEPLDEPKLRAALIDLCSEAPDIKEDDIALVFEDEEPNDWPADGNWDADYFIPSNKGSNYWFYLMGRAGEKTGKTCLPYLVPPTAEVADDRGPGRGPTGRGGLGPPVEKRQQGTVPATQRHSANH